MQEKEKTKTLHSLGKVGFKDAKKELDDKEYKEEKRKPIAIKARQLLLSVSTDALKGEQSTDVDKILEKITSNSDVKYLLKSKKIIEDDILDALEDAARILSE